MRADLTFITRDECVNSPDMFNNLDDALRRLGLALDYQVVNLGSCPQPIRARASAMNLVCRQ